jgi:hypothetical protein
VNSGFNLNKPVLSDDIGRGSLEFCGKFEKFHLPLQLLLLCGGRFEVGPRSYQRGGSLQTPLQSFKRVKCSIEVFSQRPVSFDAFLETGVKEVFLFIQ